jgi:hypothetical protein
MGRLYEKVLTYGTGTRYSIYILPIAIIIMIPIIVGATQVNRTDPKIGGVRLAWFFTWVEAVWLSFWAMRFVTRCFPELFRYFAGVVNSETKKYARVLENLQDTITVFGWVIISFVLYEVLFSTSAAGNTPYRWTKTFKKVLGAILVSTIIFMIEKIIVQLVSVNYHARSFNNKIDDIKHAAYLLGLLFDASRSLFPMYGKEFLDEDYIIHPNIKTFIRKGHINQGTRLTTKSIHVDTVVAFSKALDDSATGSIPYSEISHLNSQEEVFFHQGQRNRSSQSACKERSLRRRWLKDCGSHSSWKGMIACI